MSTKLACSVVPTVEICPNCKSEMTITEVTPILLADGFEDVTYRCKACRSEMKRTFKTTFGRVGTRHASKFPRASPMKQKRKLQQKPTKSKCRCHLRPHARSIRSDHAAHAAGGRACLEIAGASKRPERGKSPDARRAPRSFHNGGEVEKTGVANDRDVQ
jgi:hypothetical protein